MQHWIGGGLLFLLAGCALQPSKTLSTTEQESAHLELGLAYLEQKQLDQAEKYLKKVVDYGVAERGNGYQAHYGLALIHMQRGENSLSEHHFRQALQRRHLYPEAENGYGVLLCRMGRREEAVSHFQQAIHAPQYATPEIARNNQKACGEERS